MTRKARDEPIRAHQQAPVVASLNLSPRPGDVASNLLMARHAHPALQWIVLPELFTSAYSSLAHVHHYAESATEGESARFFSALAHEQDLHIAYGFPEQLPIGGVSDSVNLVGPMKGGLEELTSSSVLLTYRKRHLVRTTGEDLVFVGGAELPVVEAGGMRVALVVCWDLGFPEVVREAALAGAELILAPAGWREPWGNQYSLSCAARALDNAVYLASANQVGIYPEATFGTAGGVYGPDGVVCVSEGTVVPSDIEGAIPGGVPSGVPGGVPGGVLSGVLSVAEVDPGFPGRWRRFYGDTVLDGRSFERRVFHLEVSLEVRLEACS